MATTQDEIIASLVREKEPSIPDELVDRLDKLATRHSTMGIGGTGVTGTEVLRMTTITLGVVIIMALVCLLAWIVIK